MKRSSMLEILTQYFDQAKYTGTLQTQRPIEIATTVLQLVEGGGMIPPKVWVDTYTNGPEERHKWEPESDIYY